MLHVLVFIKLEPESNDCGPSLAMLQLGIINSDYAAPQLWSDLINATFFFFHIGAELIFWKM